MTMRRDVLHFFALAFGLTWLGLGPSVAAHLGVIGPVPEALHLIGALGPITAAILICYQTGGHRKLLRSTFRNLPPRPWLLVAVVTPFVLLLLAAVGVTAFGGTDASGRVGQALDWNRLADQATRPAWWWSLWSVSIAFGFGEEPGWRGFALPRLQDLLPAWLATVIVSGAWALWHAPMFVYRYAFEGAGTVIGFVLSLIAGAFWLTFLYNSTGGSVMAVALWHTLWNVANLVAAELGAPLVMTLNALMMAGGFGVLVVGPRHLSATGRRVQEQAPRPLSY